MDKTTEFSFILKPSQHGIGVFATHDIKEGTYLRLFGDEKLLGERSRQLNKSDVPELFQQYCMDRNDTMICPHDFGQMPIGWHLNHSNKPNATHKNYDWYALSYIKSGEEITIDYNSLEEPEDAKENYYRS